jgi:hypothetical protein
LKLQRFFRAEIVGRQFHVNDAKRQVVGKRSDATAANTVNTYQAAPPPTFSRVAGFKQLIGG